jgi:hypothetical protein
MEISFFLVSKYRSQVVEVMLKADCKGIRKNVGNIVQEVWILLIYSIFHAFAKLILS